MLSPAAGPHEHEDYVVSCEKDEKTFTEDMLEELDVDDDLVEFVEETLESETLGDISGELLHDDQDHLATNPIQYLVLLAQLHMFMSPGHIDHTLVGAWGPPTYHLTPGRSH